VTSRTPIEWRLKVSQLVASALRPDGNAHAKSINQNGAWVWISFVDGVPLQGTYFSKKQASDISASVKKSQMIFLYCKELKIKNLQEGFKIYQSGVTEGFPALLLLYPDRELHRNIIYDKADAIEISIEYMSNIEELKKATTPKKG
jgi:hypothetical protein